MNSLSQYIFEKLHLDKDMTINDVNVFTEISDIINNYFQKKLALDTEEFVYMFEDDEGNITHDESKLAIIYFYSKYFEDKDIDKVANYLANVINKIKPINKTEVFATSIYIYFK